ncbi:uncharacterized protein LOC141856790 [Brevipalpus obovatus]|uniref:uncharacterized protein LOC141856790 n=1 Tax=Brevipalpus obovatus TaxID=246614 RepID=UPI003D9E739D
MFTHQFLIRSLLFILLIAFHLNLGNSIRCEIKRNHPKLPNCWPLTYTDTCTFCNDECSERISCNNGGHCCVKECGTACSPPNVTQKLERGLVCPGERENLAHRDGCPPIQVIEKCHECKDYCQSDAECDNKICCPTLCGKRCHEIIIF